MSTPTPITPDAITVSPVSSEVVSMEMNVGAQVPTTIVQPIVVGDPFEDTSGGGGTPGECPELSWQLFPRR